MRDPELLPVLERGERLLEFLRDHPEAVHFYKTFYGDGIGREIRRARQDIRRGICDASVLGKIFRTYEERTRYLAAPAGNWN